jgi:hypothetical protein
MSTRKYRLADPIDNDNVAVSYQLAFPTASLRLPRLAMSNNAELSSRPVLLNNAKPVKKVSFNPPARWWLVLPCLLFIMLASASDPLLMNDLIVRRYERHYGLNASAGAQRATCRESVTTPAPIEPVLYWEFMPPDTNPLQPRPDYNLVQRAASSFNIKNSIATLIPALFTFILLGSNSDIIGRRPLLVLPLLGKVVRYSLMLIIVYRDLSDAWLIATHALEAIFGSSGLVMLSALAYITDCTNESRTRAFLLTEVMAVIARIIPVLAVSLWLRHHLYIVPLSVSLILSVIGLLYALFVQPESVESV